MDNEKLKSFAIELYKINAIKFGNYKTKVGLMTPVYCDLRVIVSYPKLMDTLATLIIDYTKHLKPFDIICGVPYTALPIATTVSVKINTPMVMRRKEAKDYGTRKLIEGCFKKGDHCLIIEDVVTSGSSILETVKDLKASGIVVKEVIVLLNREQGGEKILEENNIKMHALLTMTQLMDFLKQEKLITEDIYASVKDYLPETQVTDLKQDNKINRLKLSYEERAKYAQNPIAAKLFKIMSEKQTNLCYAADLVDTDAILDLADRIGPYICLLKTHVDIVHNFNENFVKHLKQLSQKHNFILFEDRKFADIGQTVKYQYSKGLYKISSWACLVTAHSVTGKTVLDAIQESEGLQKRGVFLLAETSAANNFINDSYTKATLKLAEDYQELIAGIVCQNPLFLDKPGFIQLTPGVQLNAGGDSLGQQYNSPDSVILEKGADVAVVGRGISSASNPAAAAENYRKILWETYLNRLE